MTPQELGLPAKFPRWRPHQADYAKAIARNKRRLFCLCAPTGVGKSLIAVAAALMIKGRAVILTATKNLQDQYVADFGTLGLADLRGKQAYSCGNKEGWTCEDGHVARCPSRKGSNCPYRSALQSALNSNLIVTNYAAWITRLRYSGGLGEVDFLVLDEAHLAESCLSSCLTVIVPFRDVYERLLTQPPIDLDKPVKWQDWCRANLPVAEQLYEHWRGQCAHNPSESALRLLKHYKNLARGFQLLSESRIDDWVVSVEKTQFRFEPIRIFRYVENYLFAGVKRILAMSATLTPHFTRTLDIAREEQRSYSIPPVFPRKALRVVHVPTAKMVKGVKPPDIEQWLSTIDSIIDVHPADKGIVHTVSYDRGLEIVNRSRHQQKMLFARQGELPQAIAQFKLLPPPLILISPAAGVGLDFPDDLCRYQIIAKVPYPDISNRVVAARLKANPLYASSVAALALMQACGRATRHHRDFSVVYIVDDSIVYLISRHRRFFSPWWFHYYLGSRPLSAIISKKKG